MDSAFSLELSRFGPARLNRPISLDRARRYCSRLARAHYENFTVASLLLPRRLLRHFHHVYAYCRWADDLADETGNEEAPALLAWWRSELELCYGGRPRHPVMIALCETIDRFHIPAEPFLDLLAAFEQDQRVKRYSTFEDLLGYCRHSANPVGRLVLYLCEAHDAERACLSDCICTALQLANFWQDVARDLDIGRVYIPAEDRERFGYTEADLSARRFTPAFAQLMRFEVGRTRKLFLEGWPLLKTLRPELRVDIDLFVRGGLAILRKIEQGGYNVWRQRPVLAHWEKAALILGAGVRRVCAGWSS